LPRRSAPSAIALVNESEIQRRLADPIRISVVSDSHLAPAAPACNANCLAVREYVVQSGSDLTVHLGDITLDAASDSSQLDGARAMCEPWPTMFRFLPGNHDIGDNPPGPEQPAQQQVRVYASPDSLMLQTRADAFVILITAQDVMFDQCREAFWIQ